MKKNVDWTRSFTFLLKSLQNLHIAKMSFKFKVDKIKHYSIFVLLHHACVGKQWLYMWIHKKTECE